MMMKDWSQGLDVDLGWLKTFGRNGMDCFCFLKTCVNKMFRALATSKQRVSQVDDLVPK